MKKFTSNCYSFLVIVFLVISGLTGAQTDINSELTAEYGPPLQANTWEQFIIPLTAETFNTDSETFTSAMENITSFWIKTEMHYGSDVGGIDEVQIGDTFSSYFDSSSELWSSGGDGTMEWISSDGVNDGFLQISDWATGDWHWLIAPSSWSGDWSSLIGQDISFWFKTNHPSQSAVIKLTTETVYRLTISTPESSTVPLNDSVLIQLEISPPPIDEMTISLTTSNNSCINVPATVLVPAENSIVYTYFLSAQDAIIGCESVVEATAVGYLSSRITIKVEGHSGFKDPIVTQKVNVSPNPFSTTTTIEYSLNSPQTVTITFYNQFGKEVDRIEQKQAQGKQQVAWTPDLPGGIYYFRLEAGEQVASGKVVLMR